jgi:hypothetical protein
MLSRATRNRDVNDAEVRDRGRVQIALRPLTSDVGRALVGRLDAAMTTELFVFRPCSVDDFARRIATITWSVLDILDSRTGRISFLIQPTRHAAAL